MKKEIKITKVKITKTGMQVLYDEIHTDDENNVHINKMQMEGGVGVHEDMQTALKGLRIHAALISEQVHGKLNKIDALFVPVMDSITVTGFVMGGDDENAGVTIIAQRKLKSGKVLNLVCPFTKFEGEEYANGADLSAEVQSALEEAEEYLNGKCTPNAQLEMEFEEAEKEEAA